MNSASHNNGGGPRPNWMPVVVAAALLAGAGSFWMGRVTSNPSPLGRPSTAEVTDAHGGEDDHAGHDHAPGEEHQGEDASAGKPRAEGKDDHAGHDHAPGEGHDEGHEEGHGGHGHDGHDEDGHGDEPIAFTFEALRSANVKVAAVEVGNTGGTVPFNGTIEASPDKSVRVASVVPGRLVELPATIGARVKRGQLLAVVESRAVAEAQSAYQNASVALRNARARLALVEQQARGGVFARGPLESAQRAHVEAEAGVGTARAALLEARQVMENATRLARAGSYARPALENARREVASAREALRVAQAGVTRAQAATAGARSALQLRRQQASGGSYTARPVAEARRALAQATAARTAVEQELGIARSQLARQRSLLKEGLVAGREVEATESQVAALSARVDASRAEEKAAAEELERQTRLVDEGAPAQAEITQAEAQLAAAQADEKSREAEVERARTALALAQNQQAREERVFNAGLANRRETVAARSRLQAAQAEYQKAVELREQVAAILRRERDLARRGLYNAAQLQPARADVAAAQAQWNAAAAALRLLRSVPGGASGPAASARVPVRAPIDGVVLERPVARGEVVAADQQLMTVVDLSTVHVDMFLPERDISRVRLGAPVEVRVDAVPGKVFRGHVELLHNVLDPKTRTLESHAEIDNPGSLKPGMFARGAIVATPGLTGITVPADAVQDLEGKKVVFVTGAKAGTFLPRPVQTGATHGGRTAITSGLKAGEKIVVQGAFMVKAQAMKAELGHEH